MLTLINHQQKKTLSNEKSIKAKHKRVKRDANDTSSNLKLNQIQWQSMKQTLDRLLMVILLIHLTVRKFQATESAMDAASTIPGWQVVNSQQTQIPLVWGPKVLPSYTYVTFDKTNNKLVLYYSSIVITYRMVDPIIM